MMIVTELDFTAHPSGLAGTWARVNFTNGYGASVVSGPMFYTDNNRPYEIAVMRNGSIDYSSGITDDVLGYLTENEANETLSAIEALQNDE